MGATESLEKAEKAGNFLIGLLQAAKAYPFVFLFVMATIALVLCCLPNGPLKAYIDGRTEKRKLDARMNEGKRKLAAGRQNRPRGK